LSPSLWIFLNFFSLIILLGKYSNLDYVKACLHYFEFSFEISIKVQFFKIISLVAYLGQLEFFSFIFVIFFLPKFTFNLQFFASVGIIFYQNSLSSARYQASNVLYSPILFSSKEKKGDSSFPWQYYFFLKKREGERRKQICFSSIFYAHKEILNEIMVVDAVQFIWALLKVLNNFFSTPIENPCDWWCDVVLANPCDWTHLIKCSSLLLLFSFFF
jgi:hypothetical protein